ncbi:MAG TPA: TOBE domain-containing protein [Thermoplasmata archaeon]|nr:TOBE domain-containing protein [Thermoplasmata archaeon]
MSRPSRVSSTDIALLRSIGEERSVVAASHRVGVSRDLAVYRLERLARAFGGPVARGRRGGPEHGRTTLTPLGERIARGGFEVVELLDARPTGSLARPNLLAGTYRAGPPPEVTIGPALTLKVAFRAAEGERIRVALDPEAIVVARRRFPSSARNVVAARIVSIGPAAGASGRTLAVRLGGTRVRVALTGETVRELALSAGVRVYLYIKATALRRVGPPETGRRAPARRP